MFVETLKVVDGKFELPEKHFARLNGTRDDVFGISSEFALDDSQIPHDMRIGIVKCRIVYDKEITAVEYLPYTPKVIKSLKAINAGNILYDRKYLDRSIFENLLQQKGSCNDILICISNKVTDTSYSNIVFSDGDNLYTPKSYLLNGIRRQELIAKGIIKEREICLSDIHFFERAYLINTMLCVDDNISLPTSCIVANNE